MTLTATKRARKGQAAATEVLPLPPRPEPPVQSALNLPLDPVELKTFVNGMRDAFAERIMEELPQMSADIRANAVGPLGAAQIAADHCHGLEITLESGLKISCTWHRVNVVGTGDKWITGFDYLDLLGVFGYLEPAPRGKTPDPPAKEPAPLSPETQPAGGAAFAALPVKAITVNQFERHPDNRHPSQAEVAALAADLKVNLQREPILARLLPGSGNSLQILWGEKRWLAAKQAGLPSIFARVTTCDDARALELVAQGNAQRSDFNPIEKARLIQRMCETGKTRAAAAAAVGLESDSAATNLVRLLKLPDAWQQRVASGELPESYARLLTPIVHIPAILKMFEKEWQDFKKDDYSCFEARSEVERQVNQCLAHNVRRLDEEYRYSSYTQHAPKDWPQNAAGNYPCLLELTPELRRQLGVTTVEIAEKGKPVSVEVATNVKLFEKLQYAAIKEKFLAKAKQKAKAAGAKAEAGSGPPPKTKAELAHAAKQRAAHLAGDVQEWKERLMRRSIAAAIREVSETAKVMDWRLLKLTAAFAADPGCIHSLDTVGFLPALVPGSGNGGRDRDVYELLSEVVDDSKDRSAKLVQILRGYCAALVVGVEEREACLSPETLSGLFAEWQCDLAGAWRELFDTKDPMLEEFFELHRKGELQQLGQELGLHLADSLGKPQMLKLLLGRTVPLRLPQCLQPQKPPRVKGRKPGKKTQEVGRDE